MSTAENLRVTRSASKARSTGAGSTGRASVGASSRARSRRVGAAAPLEEDDMPSVGNQVTRAYGTEGKSAQAQLLSAQIGMNQAINPIANAVANAQAPETPTATTSGRLPAVPEGPEDREGTPPRIDRRSPSIGSHRSEPHPQISHSSRWGPRRNVFNAEGADRTPHNNIANSTQSDESIFGEPQVDDFPLWLKVYHFLYTWSPPAVLVRDVLLVLLLLSGIMWFYELNRTRLFHFGAESGISNDVNTSSPLVQFLHNRVTKVEQHVQDLSLGSKSVNAPAAKHQINWFNPGFNTAIDLYLSSPTVSKCDPTWTPEGWPWSMFKSQSCPQISLSAPHFAALSPWFDPVDDSWCAPPSDGKLQLTVLLDRPVAPTELVVEHAAMDEMPVGFMGSSPREVELWIHVPNDDTRTSLLEAINHMDSSLLEDSSPQGKTLADREALPFDYVPVGRWQYDIWTNQAVQTFPLALPLAHYGVSTAKVAVRVNSNWGNTKFTCVSRLRLYGDDMSGVTEELDQRLA